MSIQQRRAGSGLLGPPPSRGDSLADILERVLDKGIVIAGDIQINLLDIELLTIKLRLIVASIDKAKEMGIDWWESDPALNAATGRLEAENRLLRERVERLERALAPPAADTAPAPSPARIAEPEPARSPGADTAPAPSPAPTPAAERDASPSPARIAEPEPARSPCADTAPAPSPAPTPAAERDA